jgi:hypothetical protein
VHFECTTTHLGVVLCGSLLKVLHFNHIIHSIL